MIIGLTGKNGSGKTVVCEYLRSRSFVYRSLSDEIRKEIQKSGREINRETLIETGNRLRNEFGPAVLAERILADLDDDQNYVIDSIRNPSEVDALRKRRDFTLLGLEAEPEIRFRRSRERGRENAAQTLEQFLEEESQELDSADPMRQQLNATLGMANLIVSNNGTLEELRRRLEQL